MTVLEISSMHSVQQMGRDVGEVKAQLQRVIELLEEIARNTSSEEGSND